ncbi:FAD-dependent oxidoreductase [Pseudooceanicola sp.]|uniref:NAD(P)/FAD-dependent oxidoreductase n=1 Tax=Pseudooceanicola sp. TaxID=1914328 RepID=UPI002618139E|nr:FAD-dependent oxidoreductase [Pseudooceanicola sp.]MDF1856186.1 FAD-dependent oxidoreductase [Pseudooceanicola sp.]
MTGVVIIGAGQGGFQAAASLRTAGYAGPVTLIGDEPGLPYQRPPLSKAYLKEGDADRLLLRTAAFYTQNDITLRNDKVAAIDRAAHTITTEDGAVLAYEYLILATGARNALPPLPGADDPAIVSLRTLGHAVDLRDRMGANGHAIVVGGGFIGLEFAAVARAAGWQVSVVEAADRVMARAVSEPTSAFFADLHRNAGVRLLTSTPAAAMNASSVTLADGEVLSGDLVVLAAGVRPNAELAAAAGLPVSNGILVDDHLRTADPAIFALGDCAAFPDPVTGAPVRLESVQAATDHARAIAATITGTPAPYDAVPWFWSDQAEAKLQIAGLAQSDDSAEVIPTEPGKLLVLRFRGGVFAALESVNMPAPHMAARQILKLDPAVSRERLAAADFDLRQVLKEMKAQG